jgi:hypothetical protein
MAPVRLWRRLRGSATRRAAAALTVALALAVADLLAGSSGPAPAAADPPVIAAQVSGTPIGHPQPAGYISLSMEFRALHQYAGRDPNRINPVLLALVRGLAPTGGQVLRVGGDSTDQTWWPMRGVLPPGGVSYGLTRGWMRTTRALARDLGDRLILGINLAARRPALAAAEARALLAGVGRANIAALEIGNEPDLYPVFAWFHDRRGRVVHSRSRQYSFSTWKSEFARWAAAMPSLPLAGPVFSSLRWMPGLDRFLAHQPGLGVVTFHRYPLRGCINNPNDASYASIDHLLADSASAGLAAEVQPYAAVSHAHGLRFRLDELNSAACTGRRGVSDTFAASLWLVDTLFNLARAGVDAVNLHTLPGAPYEPFSFSHAGDGWHAFVHPSYYGALLFDRAFPPGSRLLPVSASAGPVKVWAAAGSDGHQRVVIINKQASTPVTVQLSLPNNTRPLTAAALTAPSLAATSGVTLAGQSFGEDTTTGTLTGAPQHSTVSPSDTGHGYSVTVAAGSAMLLTQ